MVFRYFIFISFIIFSCSENNNKKVLVDHYEQQWFIDMRDGADYFQVRDKYEEYFTNHFFEKSKARTTGASWLKEKIFYIDNEGIVQPEPFLDFSNNKETNLLNFSSETTNKVGSWDMLGPVNSAHYPTSGYGNEGGYVVLNKFDPTNTEKMFVSFVTGGLWVTDDGGDNWTLTDTNLPDDNYIDIDVSISNPEIVYAVTYSQLLKSTDGGLNWNATSLNKINYQNPEDNIDIAVSPVDSDVVVVRWGKYIYRTNDGGDTWSEVISNLPIHWISGQSSTNKEILDWSTTDSDVVYFLTTTNTNYVEVYRSENSGISFSFMTKITLDPSANGQVIGWTQLLLPSSNNSSIYVAIGTGDSPYAHKAAHLYKINNTTGEEELSRINMISGVGDAYSHDPVMHHGDIAMDRNNENLIVYGSYGNNYNHYSTDNGESFLLSEKYQHTDIRSIDIVDNHVLSGNDGQTVLSEDGGKTNIGITNSISNHELWGFGSAFKSDIVASGNNHGPAMVKEKYNGYDWYTLSGADQGNTDVNPLDDRYIYSFGYSNYRYFRDGVHSFINEDNLLSVGGIYDYFNSMEFNPNHYYSVITHHSGQYPTGNENLDIWKKSLIRSDDNGNSISVVKTFDKKVFREKISMKNPNYIYVVVGVGNNNDLWFTEDGGSTWKEITPICSSSNFISDIAVSDENPNHIWVTFGGVQNSCKVLKSENSGISWTNLTDEILTNSPITKIIFQRGSNGGVYVGNKSGVYYKNDNMSNWDELGNGLPMCDIRFMFVNYNLGKLRIGTSRGAFEHDLYETSPPNALISVNNPKVFCTISDSLKFKDYSVIRNSSATWSWTFEGGTPQTSNEENPIVSYYGSEDGLYDVSLTVTDEYGTSTQHLNDFIEVSNQCGSSDPESIPGNLVSLGGNTNLSYLKTSDLNLDKSSFTFSCWIKPNGIQSDYSSIFMTDDNNTAFGLNFTGHGNNIIGFHPHWGWNSGLNVTPDEWSHVALVSNGTDVRIYVNGFEAIDNNTSLNSEIVDKILIGTYRLWGGRYLDAEIDEISIWNRALSIEEIRKWRHLTKTNSEDPIMIGLVAYYQFNEFQDKISINKISNSSHIYYMGGAQHQVSTSPVFGGESSKEVIENSGIYSFLNNSILIEFENGTYPNGEVWTSKSTINPDKLPDNNKNFNSYFVVNNYGDNEIFSPIKSVSFTNDLFTNSVPESYSIYKRNENDFGDSWGPVLDKGDVYETEIKKIIFSENLNISKFGQFILTNDSLINILGFEVQNNSDVKIFPNPISLNETIKIELPDEYINSTIIIYNNLGQIVAQNELAKKKNSLLFNLTRGSYNLLISNKENNYSSKLIVY